MQQMLFFGKACLLNHSAKWEVTLVILSLCKMFDDMCKLA